MDFLKSIDFNKIIADIFLNLDTEINLKLSAKHRGYRSAISPSQLKLTGKDRSGKISITSCRKQAHYFFDPELLLGAKLIEYDEYLTLKNKVKNCASMMVNCTIGNVIDVILCPAITKSLRGQGIWAIDQLQVISKKTGVYGNADIVLIHDDKIYVLDLKTTGHKILDRANPLLLDDNGRPILEDYKKQLYAYASSISDMFELPVGGIALINFCKTPQSSIPLTPEMLDKEYLLPFVGKGNNTLSLPITVMTYLDYAEMDRKYKEVLNVVRAETVKVCQELKKVYPSFDSWLINEELYTKLLNESETKYNKRVEELGL